MKDQQNSEEPKFKHTREPWAVQNDDPMNPKNQPSNIYSVLLSSSDGHKYTGDPVALYMKKANAQRIVDCVNACAGLTPKEIERRLNGFERLEIGDYCHASKWSDRNPYDPWAIGFLAEILITKTGTYYKLEGDEVPNTLFKHCRKITKKQGYYIKNPNEEPRK